MKKESFPKAQDQEELKNTLEEIADEILTGDTLSHISELLVENEIQEAKESLFIAVSMLFAINKISFDEAEQLFRKIGVSPERAAEMRQRAALGQ